MTAHSSAREIYSLLFTKYANSNFITYRLIHLKSSVSVVNNPDVVQMLFAFGPALILQNSLKLCPFVKIVLLKITCSKLNLCHKIPNDSVKASRASGSTQIYSSMKAFFRQVSSSLYGENLHVLYKAIMT